MQAEAMNRVVAITVFRVAADGMSHIGRMYANLVLAAGLQLIFYQRMFGGAVQHMEMGDSEFSAIIYG